MRLDWQQRIHDLRAEALVFVEEINFSETTGWRRFAWAPIGEPARYLADLNRGRSWSPLPAYTLEGYLPCASVKEGYHDNDSFYEWIVTRLLPLCNPHTAPATPRSVIIMDNVAIHCQPRIKQAIEAAGCLVRYLPPYSPDFNPIELTFSVLKSWVRRHFEEVWRPMREQRIFGEFILLAVDRSKCDSHARQHFRHATGGGYIFEADITRLELSY